MKHLSAILLSACAFLVAASPFAPAQEHAHGRGRQRGDEHGSQEPSFGVKGFDFFHDILHPLQHEALPNNDFKTIRARAHALLRAGQAVIKQPAPKGPVDRAAYQKARRSFAAALTRFRRDAARGTDAQLRASYTAVHDTFESLAETLPRPAQH